MNHTPGPWTVVIDNEYSYRGFGAKINASARLICDLSERTDDFKEGDASLISAAPELLDALEISLEYLRSKAAPLEIRNKMISAIDKAKGLAIAFITVALISLI